jgi:hypothetical protein
VVLDGADHIQRFMLDALRSIVWVRPHAIDIELERVGTGLIDEPSVLEPATIADSVQRANDRHADGLLDTAQLLGQAQVVSR